MISDRETAAEKCEEEEEGYRGCFDYLCSIQEKLGIMNNSEVFAVYDYKAHRADELGKDEHLDFQLVELTHHVNVY